MIGPREDVALMEGYHSPQLDVTVRLNTNESPYPPPQGWVEALAEAVADDELTAFFDGWLGAGVPAGVCP